MNHPRARSRRRIYEYEGLLFSFLALVVILLYVETLTGPFIFDDKPNILENSHIRLTKLTVTDLARAAFKSPIPRRPLANISFALNYYFHGYNPVAYHLVNILIHILNGIVLFLLAKTTLRTPSLRSDYETYRWIPFFTALLWLVHPLQTQSVAYIVQRMNSLATLFYLLSILLYAKSRLESKDRPRKLLLAGCILSGLFALASKEISATLPFFLLLYEWYFVQDLSRRPG